jgi:hypothetical protein
MREICPLLEGESGMDTIPLLCQEICGERWEEASMLQVGEYDDYRVESTPDCAHRDSEATHEYIYVGDNPETRRYTAVESCVDCSVEVDAKTYTFTCLNT